MPFDDTTTVLPPSVPLDCAVMTTPLVVTLLPFWSCSWITGCWAKTTPLCAVAEGWVAMASWPAEPAWPVAVKVTVTGPPVKVAVASRLLAPVAVPRVHETDASPLGLVTAVAGAVPPPLVTVKLTVTPDTGLPLPSLTSTVGLTGSGEPATAV